jgi:VIT1/CCC1 family predicted Fe2+/Mn2+ transporter
MAEQTRSTQTDDQQESSSGGEDSSSSSTSTSEDGSSSGQAWAFAAGSVLCVLLALLLPLRGLVITTLVLAALWAITTLHGRRAAPR